MPRTIETRGGSNVRVPLLNVAHDVPESCLIPEQACGQRRTPRLPQQLFKLTVDVAACHVDAPYGDENVSVQRAEGGGGSTVGIKKPKKRAKGEKSHTQRQLAARPGLAREA